MEGKRWKGTDREEETERRDGGEDTKGRYTGGEMEGKRQRGTDKRKETEGNRYRERDMQERRERRRRGEGGAEEG
jgi:hypothetical protein